MKDNKIDNIFIINKQRKFVLNKKKIKTLARFVLSEENVDNSTGINLMFTGNTKIREFNKKFLNCDTPTDVISFEGEINNGTAGDVVISVEKAAEFSSQNNINFNEELERYIVHGILHCLGYDDINPTNKKKMFKRQEQILKKWAEIQTENVFTVLPRV